MQNVIKCVDLINLAQWNHFYQTIVTGIKDSGVSHGLAAYTYLAVRGAVITAEFPGSHVVSEHYFSNAPIRVPMV